MTKPLDRTSLETLIADVRDAAIIAQIVMDDADRNIVAAGMPGFIPNYVIYMLTKEQSRALTVALLHVAGCARLLEDAFHASAGAIV